MKRFFKIMLMAVPVAWILAVLFDSPRCGPLAKTNRIKTTAILKDIVLGVRNYHTEYNRWPVTGSDEVKTRCEGDLLNILLGDNVNSLNVRGIAYIEPPMVMNGAGG